MAEGIKTVLRRNLARAIGAGDLPQAALLLERLKEEDPLSVETRGMELDYLLRSGRLQEARVTADQLVTLFPSSPRIVYLAGQVAYRAKEYGMAAERFRESHRMYAHWRSSVALAKSLTQLGELDEAASIFESLLPEHPECYVDLAWLYERKGHCDRALAAVEAYLKHHPENEMAKAQRLRLRARAMDPQELVDETQELLEFGEQPSGSVVPQYLEALFRTGQGPKARQFLWERRQGFSPHLAASAGWACYRYQAYDLAFDLFVTAFGLSRSNVKFLAAIEFAATRCGRVAELVRLYETHAPQDRRLYGHLHSLRRRSTRGPNAV